MDLLDWPGRSDFEKAALQYQVLADVLGRMEIEDDERAFENPIWVDLPYEQAIAAFLKRKILSKKEFYALEDKYRLRSFTVGKDFSDYAILATKERLDKALKEGTSRGEFIKEIQEHFDAMGIGRAERFHLETVFDNAVMGSYSHGRYQQSISPHILKSRPIHVYRNVGDSRVRETHLIMGGGKGGKGRAWPAKHKVWDKWTPLNGHRCRCRRVPMSEAQVKALGITIESAMPDVEPDEGFASSPAGWLD